MTSPWWRILTHRKPMPSARAALEATPLQRVLTALDLTALGVGSTLGVGVYVLAGQVARDTAGPSVVLSFVVAAVASVFAGLCYAEFGARVPRAGSAYIYSYVTIGEFVAFIIGWNLILEYVIGSASVARGLSLYLDALLNDTLKTTFREIAPINSTFTAEYFDFLSFSVTIFLGVALTFGLKESSFVNNIITFLNLGVVLFVIIAGSFKADLKNWSIPKSQIPPDVRGGNGGFFPYGISGTLKGAATCFYGFIGFDTIATTGEEVKNPQRSIPLAIVVSLFIIFLSYFGTSAVVTLMVPYYDQDPDASIPKIFTAIQWPVAAWIVTIGGIFGLCASLFGAMFPLPRIIYAMASDALIFKFLGTINTKYHTPAVGTLTAALLTGLMSALFDLKQLINMMSIGTLLAYTIVAACVLLLRFSVSKDDVSEQRCALLAEEPEYYAEYIPTNEDFPMRQSHSLESLNLLPNKPASFTKTLKQVFNFTKSTPTTLTENLVKIEVLVFCLLSVLLVSCIKFFPQNLVDHEIWIVSLTSGTAVLMMLVLVSMSAQPTTSTPLVFKVPLVPLVPALSICINIYLMMMLDVNTWIRFGVWMAVGLPIYLACTQLNKSKYTTLTVLSGSETTSKSIALPGTNTTINIPPKRFEEDVHPNSNAPLDQPYQDLERQSAEDDAHHNARMLSFDPQEAAAVLRELERVLDGASQVSWTPRSSTASTDDDSGGSDQHHVQAIVHREDSPYVDKKGHRRSAGVDANHNYVAPPYPTNQLSRVADHFGGAHSPRRRSIVEPPRQNVTTTSGINPRDDVVVKHGNTSNKTTSSEETQHPEVDTTSRINHLGETPSMEGPTIDRPHQTTTTGDHSSKVNTSVGQPPHPVSPTPQNLPRNKPTTEQNIDTTSPESKTPHTTSTGAKSTMNRAPGYHTTPGNHPDDTISTPATIPYVKSEPWEILESDAITTSVDSNNPSSRGYPEDVRDQSTTLGDGESRNTTSKQAPGHNIDGTQSLRGAPKNKPPADIDTTSTGHHFYETQPPRSASKDKPPPTNIDTTSTGHHFDETQPRRSASKDKPPATNIDTTSTGIPGHRPDDTQGLRRASKDKPPATNIHSTSTGHFDETQSATEESPTKNLVATSVGFYLGDTQSPGRASLSTNIVTTPTEHRFDVTRSPTDKPPAKNMDTTSMGVHIDGNKSTTDIPPTQNIDTTSKGAPGQHLKGSQSPRRTSEDKDVVTTSESNPGDHSVDAPGRTTSPYGPPNGDNGNKSAGSATTDIPPTKNIDTTSKGAPGQHLKDSQSPRRTSEDDVVTTSESNPGDHSVDAPGRTTSPYGPPTPDPNYKSPLGDPIGDERVPNVIDGSINTQSNTHGGAICEPESPIVETYNAGLPGALVPPPPPPLVDLGPYHIKPVYPRRGVVVIDGVDSSSTSDTPPPPTPLVDLGPYRIKPVYPRKGVVVVDGVDASSTSDVPPPPPPLVDLGPYHIKPVYPRSGVVVVDGVDASSTSDTPPPPPPLVDLGPYRIKPVYPRKGVVVVDGVDDTSSTSDTESVGSSGEPAKPSDKHSRIQRKLVEIFAKHKPKIAWSPRYAGVDTEVVDDVVVDVAEEVDAPIIPDDFGKTGTFKEALNNLLARQRSVAATKEVPPRKREWQATPEVTDSKDDHVKHKNLMIATLKEIKLRRVALPGVDRGEGGSQGE